MTYFQVSCPVSWRVENTSDGLLSVMTWTSADPVAVKISFKDPSGDLDWVFARDLLADVVFEKSEESGAGDVHIARSRNHGLTGRAGDQLVLTLSVGHIARLRANLSDIRLFLQDTFRHVPQGEEVVDTDSAIVKLLDGGWTSGV